MQEKQFSSLRTQIGILKGRGIIIKSKKNAKRILLRTNYYNLINGYKTLFLDFSSSTEHFLEGTRLEELFALSEFDRKLRILTLEYIFTIEKNVKTVISYCFSNVHGHKDYLSYNNFNSSSIDKFQKTSTLLKSLYGKISSNIGKEDSISHYIKTKNYLPLWVLVNAMSLGDISKFYSCMIQKEQNEVAKRIKYGVRSYELENYLLFLNSIRNRCAHDELLYNYKSYVSIKKNNFCSYFGLKKNDDCNNYFAVMIVFKSLLPKSAYNDFQEKFYDLYMELSKEIRTISMTKIRKTLGLPNNWTRLKTLNSK